MGYINQPIATPTTRNARKAHRAYFRRSPSVRLVRQAKDSEITNANSSRAWKWFKFTVPASR